MVPYDFLFVFHSQIIDEEVLCVHGGLSPDIISLDQIRHIERNREIPYKGTSKLRITYLQIIGIYVTKI